MAITEKTCFQKILGSLCPLAKSDTGKSKDFDYNGICNHICMVASSCGHPFVNYRDDLFLYEGTHWILLDKYELKSFLKEAFAIVEDDVESSSIRKVLENMIVQFPYNCITSHIQQADNTINFKNGELNFSGDSAALTKHNPKHFFRYVLPYEYNSAAQAPMFHKYLDRVVPDNATQCILAEYIAWALQPNLKLEKAAFLYGSGCNGKSVFTEIVEALLGRENVSNQALSDMCGESGDRSRAELAGKLLNICSDVSPNANSGDVFKRLASGEPITAKLLYKDAVVIKQYAKMLFCLNELPKTKDLSNGYFRRFLIIPFNIQIPQEEIDPKLSQKIIASELPGVMNWVLEGRKRLIAQNSFSQSDLCDQALENYRTSMIGNKPKTTN